MRFVSPVFICFGMLFCGIPASAQVTVDLNALNSLPRHNPAPHAPRHSAPRYGAPRPLPLPPEPPGASVEATQAPPARAVSPPVAGRPATPGTGPQVPQVPAAPPPAPPPQLVGPAPVAPAGPPRQETVTFSPGQAEIAPAQTKAITALGRDAAASPGATVNVLAYAPGDPNDPSTARRMSLERALSVRSVLISAGVPSSRIYVRALGSQAGAGSPDRADISLLGANIPPATEAVTKAKQ